MYRHTDVKVSSQSCNTEHKIQPELQQGTEDTARAIAGTEDTVIATAADRRYSQNYSRGQKIQLWL